MWKIPRGFYAFLGCGVGFKTIIASHSAIRLELAMIVGGLAGYLIGVLVDIYIDIPALSSRRRTSALSQVKPVISGAAGVPNSSAPQSDNTISPPLLASSASKERASQDGNAQTQGMRDGKVAGLETSIDAMREALGASKWR